MQTENEKEVLQHLLNIQKVMFNLVSALVEKPQNLRIDIVQGTQMHLFEIRCDSSDRGKCIGKQGIMAGSLRNILIALSAKKGLRTTLEICD